MIVQKYTILPLFLQILALFHPFLIVRSEVMSTFAVENES